MGNSGDLVVPRLNLAWTKGTHGPHQSWAARNMDKYLKSPKKRVSRHVHLSTIESLEFLLFSG